MYFFLILELVVLREIVFILTHKHKAIKVIFKNILKL